MHHLHLHAPTIFRMALNQMADFDLFLRWILSSSLCLRSTASFDDGLHLFLGPHHPSVAFAIPSLHFYPGFWTCSGSFCFCAASDYHVSVANLFVCRETALCVQENGICADTGLGHLLRGKSDLDRLVFLANGFSSDFAIASVVAVNHHRASVP